MDSSQVIKIIALAMSVSVLAFAIPLLLARETARRDQVVLLAGFLGVYGAVKLDALLLESGFYAAAPHTAGIMFAARFLLPPAIFFYVRATTSLTPRWLERGDLWAAACPALLLVAMLPIYLQAAPVKVEMIAGNVAATPPGAYAIVLCKIAFAAFLGVAGVYVFRAFMLLPAHVRRVRDAFSNVEKITLDWLSYVLVILAAGWALIILGDFLAIWGARPPWYGPVLAYLELGWIAVIAFQGLRQKPPFEEPVAVATAEVASANYSRSALGHEQMVRIGSKLVQALSGDRLHTDPALSLRALSTHIGVSENYVSETLNKHLGDNFFDFVNGYRVADARQFLLSTNRSVLTIALDVGFNSRSTFYAAFKKHVGVSPNVFRRNAKPDNPVGEPEATLNR